MNRCRVIPLADHQLSIQIDGQERLRWHCGPNYPRPFFFPLVGPSGQSLTRMGHPGAPDHDHHRSIWFAHADVVGIDFWSDQTAARIRQLNWLCYEDSDEEARMAVRLGWFDGHDPQVLLEQDVYVAIRPLEQGEVTVEFLLTFRPLAERLEFGKTNFGVLGVRVAKSVSVHFGGGTISDSEGRQSEAAIFGKPAKWVDYSGLISAREHAVAEGITYFDHVGNPGYPSGWHVREDGWMTASPCMSAPLVTARGTPLMLRYLLHAHGGPCDPVRAALIAGEFNDRPPLRLVPSGSPHVQHALQRG